MGASVTGLPASSTLDELGFDVRNDGHCGAGAPRFNVYTSSGVYYFFGCHYGTHTPAPGDPDNWTRVLFRDSDAAPAYVTQPEWPGFGNAEVYAIDIVFDEGTDVGEGFVYLDNININGNLIGNPTPTISVSNATVRESDSGIRAPVSTTFTVKLSAPSTQTVQVRYSTANGSAVAGIDYTAVSGDLTFPPGVQTRTITVPVIADNRDEMNERFFLNLAAPVNAVVAPLDGTLDDLRGVGTILDNDPLPTLSIDNAPLVTEPASGQPNVNAVFTVRLSAPSGRTIKVQYATANGSAVAGSDYDAVSGTLTFVPGVRTRSILVPVRGDALSEGNQRFFVNLSNPVNAVVTPPNNTLTDSRGVATIADPN